MTGSCSPSTMVLWLLRPSTFLSTRRGEPHFKIIFFYLGQNEDPGDIEIGIGSPDEHCFEDLLQYSRLKGVWHTRFSTSGFFHKSVSPGPLSISLGSFRIFQKFAEIFVNECLSGMSMTPAKKDKNFEIKFFKIFCQELSLVHFTPKDWIFTYFSFLGEGKLI